MPINGTIPNLRGGIPSTPLRGGKSGLGVGCGWLILLIMLAVIAVLVWKGGR